MNNHSGQWADLAWQPFTSTVRAVADPRATPQGFLADPASDPFNVRYRHTDGRVVQFEYLVETAPRYEFRCLLGLEQEGRVELVPLWYLEKIGVVSAKVPDEFLDRSSLRRAITSCCDILFAPPGGVLLRGLRVMAEWNAGFAQYSAAGGQSGRPTFSQWFKAHE